LHPRSRAHCPARKQEHRRQRTPAACPQAGAQHAAGTPENSLDPSNQFGHRERLDQIIIGSRVQSRDALLNRVAGSQDQNRDGVVLGADLSEEVEAVTIREPKIEDRGTVGPITGLNVGKAIGAYERMMTTPAPFDEFLAGDINALAPGARAGLEKFIATGCAGCHHGVGVGGNSYQKFGITEEYRKRTGSDSIDKGRIDITKSPDDLYVFRVPVFS